MVEKYDREQIKKEKENCDLQHWKMNVVFE
jgi:hypothetical protein